MKSISEYTVLLKSVKDPVLRAEVLGQLQNDFPRLVNSLEDVRELFRELSLEEVDDFINLYQKNNGCISNEVQQISDTNCCLINNISMQILGGFIAVVGCAAVATAFTLLNAATFGIAGLIVAGIGVASTLAGVGLFATGTYRNMQITTPEVSSDLSMNIA